MASETQKIPKKAIPIRDLCGIWANTLSYRETQGQAFFEHLENVCRFKNCLVSGPGVLPIGVPFPVGSNPQDILCGFSAARERVVNPNGSLTLLIGEENLFAMFLQANGSITVQLLPIDVTSPPFPTTMPKLGTKYSKPIAFQEGTTGNIIILTYLGYIIEVDRYLTTARYISYDYRDPKTGDLGTIYRSMVACKIQGGLVLGTMGTNADVTAAFDKTTALLYKLNPFNDAVPVISLYYYEFDTLTSAISPTQQHFQITTLSENWFFQQEEALPPYTPTIMDRVVFPYFVSNLSSIGIYSTLFDGNNISCTTSIMRDPINSALPDWDNLNSDFYSEDIVNDPQPPIIRNLTGACCQNLESLFFNRVNKGSQNTPPINRMMSLSYDFFCYAYHSINNWDTGFIGAEYPLYCFFQSTLGDYYPLATYGTSPILINGTQTMGVLLQNRDGDVLPKRHRLLTMKLNAFDNSMKYIYLEKIWIECRVTELTGDGFRLFVHGGQASNGTASSQQYVIPDDIIPTGKNVEVMSIPTPNAGGYDIQVEIIVDCKYLEITGLYYAMSETDQ